MLIKNTNPNELLAEFERDDNFCPYDEKGLEELKKEAKRLYKYSTHGVHISHDGVELRYRLSDIINKTIRYEYGEYGSILKISPTYLEKQTEYVRFEEWYDIVFFYEIANSDGKSAWSLKVKRMDNRNKEVWLWIGEEVKFKKVGY